MGFLDELEETQHGHRARVLFFLDRLRDLENELNRSAAEISILDLGCGNGQSVSLPIGDAGYQVTGVDFHEPSIQWARDTNSLENVRFIVGDITTELPLVERYDVVILADILEHLPNPKSLLLSTHKYINKEGMLLISIPNGYGPFEIENFLIRIGLLKPLFLLVRKIAAAFHHENLPPSNIDSGHVQWFTKKRFVSLLEETGFQATHFHKGAVSGGDLSGMFVRRFPPLMRFGVASAQYLPSFVSSVWHWEARLINDLQNCSG